MMSVFSSFLVSAEVDQLWELARAPPKGGVKDGNKKTPKHWALESYFNHGLGSLAIVKFKYLLGLLFDFYDMPSNNLG